LIIKTIKGSRLSGVVVLEGNETSPAMLNGLQIYASVASPESGFGNSARSVVAPDGTFSINGVRSGLASFGVYSFADNRKKFEILRVERNGIPSETINVKEHGNVTGIRVVVKAIKLTGAIRGQLKVESGELPPISQISLDLWPLDENLEPKRTSSIKAPQLDARGRFFGDGLPAGSYRLTVSIYASGGTKTAEQKTQQVTVTDDAVTEVTVTIKSQPDPN
ncbi:MAG TPA: carboxypeptidase-like regulatory domain-containing protein, partial [Anaerolineales bacterium]|nr:carboxypeptidase-like regulatory domain-containing protein [Anaerolineales bacterium]